MRLPPPALRSLAAAALLAAAYAADLRAQPPGEVGGVLFQAPAELLWSPVAGADTYNVYRGDLTPAGTARCHAFDLAGPPFSAGGSPAAGQGWFYLVTAASQAEGEGPPGGAPRPLLGTCAQVMRNHVLDRAGYGWNEWSRNRIETLGLEGYVNEQLNPISINESTNTELLARLAPISEPQDIVQLIQQQVVRAVYSRRQLQHQVATFWTNHFNTDWAKLATFYQGVFPPCDDFGEPPQCDPAYPARAYEEASRQQFLEVNTFRGIAFNGNFRQLVEASALSPAMVVYLDTIYSVAGAPNENYPRELMELHTMGVDGGYTQADVEELSRVITGWTLCKKTLLNVNDPLAPCLPDYWDESVPGEIATTYYWPYHDCTAKTLFAGTPQEVAIPDTCADPVQGVQDLYTALDAIVAHPSTPQFVARKILERFVSENPEQELVDELVGVWNDAGNPHGVGDLKAVLQAALTSEAFLDPNRVRNKIKTPLEQFTSTVRATRGRTDGLTGIINSLVLAYHIPHYNPVPTGWPEDGASWIGTNNYLERQNFAVLLLGVNLPEFGADPIGLLQAGGVSTAPGNSAAIVDFFSDVLFGGALTPAERQIAIDFLDTDDLGVPAPYDEARIRDVVAFLLGYPHFQEQ